jgi:hypothetical protein
MADIDIGNNLYQVGLVALVIIALIASFAFNQPTEIVYKIAALILGGGGAGALALAETIKKKVE